MRLMVQFYRNTINDTLKVRRFVDVFRYSLVRFARNNIKEYMYLPIYLCGTYRLFNYQNGFTSRIERRL